METLRDYGGNLALDMFRGSLRIGSISNRPPDHDIICAILKGFLNSNDPFLVIFHQPVFDGSNPRTDD